MCRQPHQKIFTIGFVTEPTSRCTKTDILLSRNEALPVSHLRTHLFYDYYPWINYVSGTSLSECAPEP